MTKLGFLSLGASDLAPEDHGLKAVAQKAAAAAAEQGRAAPPPSQHHAGHSAHDSQAWDRAMAAERAAAPSRSNGPNPYISPESHEAYDRSGASQQRAAVDQDVNVNVVGRALQVVGDITSPGAVTVHGLIKGDIECDQLVIGTGGRIEGDIRADVVQVHGSVFGAISARAVKLFATSEVSADITHYNIGIELGANYSGALIRAESVAMAQREQVEEQPMGAAHPPRQPQQAQQPQAQM